jgi:excisionase family DNA binding protein
MAATRTIPRRADPRSASEPAPEPDAAPRSALLLAIPEVAAALGIGRTKVYELIGTGQLEAVHIGRSCRVPADSLETFVGRLRAG